MRHARHQAHGDDDEGRDRQRLGRGEHLTIDLLAHVFGGRHSGDGRGDRQQQRGNLGDQAVTDGQQGVDARGVAERQAVLGHADGHAADEVDEEDQQAGNGVTADEFAGTVHGAVEVGFLAHFGPALLGFGLVDDAGVQVGVDGHLLAGHRVQGEARRHLGDAAGALGHHHEVDDHEDGEHHRTDYVVAADHHFAEGLDDLARGVVTVLAVQQHDAARGHVQR